MLLELVHDLLIGGDITFGFALLLTLVNIIERVVLVDVLAVEFVSFYLRFVAQLLYTEALTFLYAHLAA